MKHKTFEENIFGERLREMRKEKCYSMDRFCELFNKTQSTIKLNKSTISRYENGTQEPMVSTVAALATFLKVSPAYLMGESNTKNCSISDIKHSIVVQGNNENTWINCGNCPKEQELSGQAAELLRIFENLSIREQTELLSFAFQLESRSTHN